MKMLAKLLITFVCVFGSVANARETMQVVQSTCSTYTQTCTHTVTTYVYNMITEQWTIESVRTYTTPFRTSEASTEE